MYKGNNSPLFYASTVILSGILVLFVILLVDFYFGKSDYTLKGTFIRQIQNPAFWIIYLTPLLAGFLIYRLTGIYNRKLDALNSERDRESNRLNNVNKYVQSMLTNLLDETVELDYRNDPLAKSLSLLNESIASNKKEEAARRKEDAQRRWVSEGLAMFGEILRSNHDNLQELSYNIISHLVKYTNSNQGALFILNDDIEYNKYFEMTACYAYERRKFAEDKIEFGEGLIGTCALEKQTIYLTEIPDSYLNITSGLGKANPKCLLLVPLKINEENHGVIEIASFNEYPGHEIEFIEKIAESVAATISGVKINLKTAKLLKESTEQAEIMASQEEEMRQNMEELQATQEEAARQSERFVSFSNSVNNTLLKAEYDLNGTIVSANENFLRKLGYNSQSEVEGKSIKMFINPVDQEWFDNQWTRIVRLGEKFEGEIKHISKSGKDFWMLGTFTPVTDQYNALKGILFLALDATEPRHFLEDFREQLHCVDSFYPRALFGIDGTILFCNSVLSKLLGYNTDDLIKKSLFGLLSYEEKESFQNIWESISSGNTFEGQLKFITSKNEDKWLGVAFSAMKNSEGDFSKISLIAFSLDKEKQLEASLASQNEHIHELTETIRKLKAELKTRS